MGVEVESLESVWLDSKCRIDNSLDARHPPQRKGEEIKELALKYAKREKDFEHYDLAENNCEPFASWVRNGKMCSQQVTNTKRNAIALITSAVFVVWDAVDLGITIHNLVKDKGSEAGNVLRKEARRKEEELKKYCCCFQED